MRAGIWKLLRWFLFRIDAETAHRVTMVLIRLGTHLGNVPLWIASGADRKPGPSPLPTVFGLEFRSRIGLAAGFDKDAEIVTGLPALGFGFAELGTITPRPQPGNERPRLFRDPEAGAVFNRMGFNGLGATLVSERLARARPRLPAGFRVGVNIGKNKDTPLEEAAADYARAIAPFDGLADYVVINVSSPNTPGLRSLQTVEALKPIVDGVNAKISAWTRRPPLLLKLAPELKGLELAQLIQAAEGWGINGWVLTNTLGGTRALSDAPDAPLTGGWSGKPLTLDSRKALLEARALTKLPIISVGGILTAEEAIARRSAGADLVQVYSGWIFNGPSFPVELARRLT